MNVYSEIPGYTRLASIPALSKKARQRLITGEVFRHKTIKLKLGYKRAATIRAGERYLVTPEQVIHRYGNANTRVCVGKD